jgi:DNA (cytosine-5)-methyltransferase 1
MPSAFRQPTAVLPAYKVVSLFSGCGGLDLGFKEQGYDLVYACDNDPAAVESYTRNIDQRVFLRDVQSQEFQDDIANIGKCDIVLGGFPCQGFSKAGPKNMKDQRNVLYVEMKHTVAALQPAVFIAENVDGISQNFNGAYLNQIVTDFKEIGYQVEYRILDAIAYGLPQHRRRIFFVGVQQAAPRAFPWPIETHQSRIRNGEFKITNPYRGEAASLWDDVEDNRQSLRNGRGPFKALTIKDAISDLIELDPNTPDHKVTNTWPKNYEAIFRAIKPGQKLCNVRHASTSVYTWQIPDVFGATTDAQCLILQTIAENRRHKKYGNIPNGNPLPIEEIERLSGLTDIARDIEVLLSKGYLKEIKGSYDLKGAMFNSGLFKRPLWDEPSPTVLTNFHNPRYFLHPLKDRPFSLRECARLQGFPDSFTFTEYDPGVSLVAGYRLVGNAVPPPLSSSFASAVRQFLSMKERQAV